MRYRIVLALLLTFGCSRPAPNAEVVDGWMQMPDGGASIDASAMVPDVSPPAPGITDLSIATWNIEQFPGHAGTIEAVRDLVIEHDLDLIGVQEITDPAAFERLAEMLPEHEMFFSFDDWAFTRVGFLYRTGRITVGTVERLFRRETYAFPRDPLAAEITVLDDDGSPVFDFTFVVVHLKAQGDEESRQRRLAAVASLDTWIQDRMRSDPDVIVAGDFNDQLTDRSDANVFGPFLDAPERYRFLTLESEQSGAYSYIPFPRMIDHVLVTTDALDEYGEGTTEVLEIDRSMPEYVDLVSDHLPVVSRFRIDTR